MCTKSVLSKDKKKSGLLFVTGAFIMKMGKVQQLSSKLVQNMHQLCYHPKIKMWVSQYNV